LNPVLQVDKEKWETFLSEFSELAKNYELILSKLDLALGQIEVERERNRQLTAKGREVLLEVRMAVEKLCKETEDALDE
jgi:hypothetical protein